MADLFTFANLGDLIMLIFLQAVLGFDNLLYISIESQRAPAESQAKVRRNGILIAIALRIVLLFTMIQLIDALQAPFFEINIPGILEGSFNFAGTAEPALDSLIAAMLAAKTEEAFRDAVRAYDRALISGHYVVPLYHLGESRLARWKRIQRPETTPLYGPQFQTWWYAGAPN